MAVNWEYVPSPTYDELKKSKDVNSTEIGKEMLEIAKNRKEEAERKGISPQELEKQEFLERISHLSPEEQDSALFLHSDTQRISLDVGVSRVNGGMDSYAKVAVQEGAFETEEEFYIASGVGRGDYRYSKKFIRQIVEEFVNGGGASKVIKESILKNCFTNPLYNKTIGKRETGQFVSIANEDSTLFEKAFSEYSKKDAYKIIAEAKGIDVNSEQLYQCLFDVSFIEDIANKELFMLPNGSEMGANSLFVPGARTFSRSIQESQREAIIPAVSVENLDLATIKECVTKNVSFIVQSPTIVDKDGNKRQISGKMEIRKL